MLGSTATKEQTMGEYMAAQMGRQIEGAISENEQLRRDLDIAIGMLAAWCVAVDVNGTGWDDWDEHYKDAAYRPGPLRELLDAAIAAERAQRVL
jgi:hypothetical protein